MSTNIKTKRQISITGVSNKLGVTHICLSIANFLASGLRKKVLYIELSDDSALLPLVGNCPVSIGEFNGFLYQGVHYVLGCSVGNAHRLLNLWDGFVVIDISSLNSKSMEIFNRCEKKIVLGSMKAWCKRDIFYFINKWKGVTEIKGIDFFNKSNNKNEANLFYREYKIPLTPLPFIDDPFSLKEEHFMALSNMIR